MLTGKEWIKIQEVLIRNESKRYRRPRKNTALLTGILRCSCGAYMRPKLHSIPLKDGTRRFDYVCEIKERSKKGKCQERNINGNQLDELLIEEIKKLTAPNSKICSELEKIINEKPSIDCKSEEEKQLENLYKKNQKSLENLIDRIKYVDIELIDYINNEIKKLKQENKEIEEKLQAFKNEEKIEQKDVDTAKLVLEVLEKYFSKFESLDIMQQKSLIKFIINEAVANGDEVDIDLLNDEPDRFFLMH